MCTASNNQPAQGGIQGFLAKAPDPLHISNGGGGLDPLNLFGSVKPPTLAPGPENPPDAISAEQLNEINYDQNLVRQRMLTAQGQQSTILTGPTGLAANPLGAGLGKAGVAAPKTLLGG